MICCTPLSLFLTSLTFLPIIKQRTEPLHSVFSLKVKHAPSSPPTLHIFRIRGQKDAVCRIDIVVAPSGLDSCVYCTSYPASFSTANIAQIYHVSCLNSRQLLIRPLDSRHCFGNKRIQSAPDAGWNLSNSRPPFGANFSFVSLTLTLKNSYFLSKTCFCATFEQSDTERLPGPFLPSLLSYKCNQIMSRNTPYLHGHSQNCLVSGECGRQV